MAASHPALVSPPRYHPLPPFPLACIGYFLNPADASFLSQHFIDTGAGVIDADYRGQVKILLFNHADTDFPVSEGDRVAQLVLERIYTPNVVEVTELEESVRGAGGFGSTGGFGGEPVATTVSSATDGGSGLPSTTAAAVANGAAAINGEQQKSSSA